MKKASNGDLKTKAEPKATTKELNGSHKTRLEEKEQNHRIILTELNGSHKLRLEEREENHRVKTEGTKRNLSDKTGGKRAESQS